MMRMIALLVLVTAGGSAEADQRLLYMANVYEKVCLKAFPDDRAVQDAVQGVATRELTPSEVKVTMNSDPARAWELKDGSSTVWLELPPYHACSVRWNTPTMPNLAPYRAISDTYEGSSAGFKPMKSFERNQGVIQIHAVGEQRALKDGSVESLFVVDQQISDPKLRENGETGVVLRFVHQLALPAAKAN